MAPGRLPLGLLAATLGAALTAPPAAAKPGERDDLEPRTKKALRLEAKEQARAGDPEEAARERKRRQAELDRRVGKPPPDLILVYNTWTRELVAVDADPKSPGGSISREQASRFLRCHFTNRLADMDPRLFSTLVSAARHFRAERVDVVSGFRSPKYNLILRKKGRRVARESRHTMGQAVDFRVRGVASARLLAWARGLRLGGVGFYPSSGFVHVDVGPVRTWTTR
jgi:uncharacterized protein YcbK (DUF882 family)